MLADWSLFKWKNFAGKLIVMEFLGKRRNFSGEGFHPFNFKEVVANIFAK